MVTKPKASESPKTLQRGLDVLATIASSPIGLNISEIARAVRISRQSVYRALAVLEDRGFVRQLAASGRYFLAGRIIELIETRPTDHERMAAIRRVMLRLCDETKWPVVVSSPDGLQVVVWETTDSLTPQCLEHFTVGFRVPMLESASGLAYLSHLPSDRQERMLDRLAASAEPLADLARTRSKCLAILRSCRSHGYAITTHGLVTARMRRRNVDDSEPRQVSGKTTSISVPIMVDGLPVACIGLRYFDSAMSRVAAARRYFPRLKQVARQIAAKWHAPQIDPTVD